MERYLCCEIDLICLLIIWMLIWRSYRSALFENGKKLFRRILAAMSLMLIADAACFLANIPNNSTARIINIIACMVYSPSMALVGYFALEFYIYRIRPEWYPSRKTQFILAIPLLILVISAVFTPWTKWIFIIDESNVFRRGAMHWIQDIVAYGYLAAAFIIVVIATLREKMLLKRKEDNLLLAFFYLPMFCSLLNYFFPYLPVTWPSVTISLLFLYIDLQERDISTDKLTGLNNRSEFDRRIAAVVQVSSAENSTYLIMMDLDGLKKINDTYGHTEGDNALRGVASCLRAAVKNTNTFLARYGGDEFVMIANGDNDGAAEKIKAKIDAALSALNKNEAREYKLALSIGYGKRLPGEMVTDKELIDRADKMLYLEKAARKGLIIS